MNAVPWTVGEFRKRRAATWRAIRFWLLFELLALAALFALPKGSDRDMSEASFTENLICFVVLGACSLVIIFAVRRLYRCPKCEAIPMGRWTEVGSGSFAFRSGVNLYPVSCPNCGAPLSQ